MTGARSSICPITASPPCLVNICIHALKQRTPMVVDVIFPTS